MLRNNTTSKSVVNSLYLCNMFRPVIDHPQVGVQDIQKRRLCHHETSPVQKLDTVAILKLLFEERNNV